MKNTQKGNLRKLFYPFSTILWIWLLVLSNSLFGQNVRPLFELNTSESESYPYLNKDGLRLYFVRGGISNGKVFLSTRTSVNSVTSTSYWGGASDLSIEPNKSILSFWLSDDELTIYYTTNDNKLFYKYRANLTLPFSSATAYEITLTDVNKFHVVSGASSNVDYILTSPSLSADKSTLYLFYNSYAQQVNFKDYNPIILKFNCISSSSVCSAISGSKTYACVDVFASPNENSDVSNYSGQLAKNVTTSTTRVFDLSKKTKSSNTSSLSKISWTTPPNYTLQNQTILGLDQSAIPVQPSVNYDRNILVFVASAGTWNSNNLYSVEYPSVQMLREELFEEDVEKNTFNNSNDFNDNWHEDGLLIYPNPTTSTINIRLNLQSAEKGVEHTMVVKNMAGIIVAEFKARNMESTNINDLGLLDGVYVISIKGIASKRLNEKVVIVK